MYSHNVTRMKARFCNAGQPRRYETLLSTLPG